MADPHSKKVFSIFQPKSKPVPPPPSTAETSPPDPSTSTSRASTSTASSPEAIIASNNPSKTKRLAPAASKDSDCITLGSSDDEDLGSSSTVNSSSRRTKTSSITTQNGKGKGKGKARAIVVDPEEDDLVVIKGLTPEKGTKGGDGKKRKVKEENGKKGKKALKTMESIDLTTSPPRKPISSSFNPSASTSFAPLSDVYRQERERRKVNEGIEPRWPTAEEHGHFTSTTSTSEAEPGMELQRYPLRLSENGKGKGKDVENGEEGFLERFAKSIEQDSSAPRFSPSSSHTPNYTDLPIASTSTLLPSYPSHPLLDRLAAPFRSVQPNQNQSRADQAVQSELWTTKYGPKKAEEVLGNLSGGSALILKEWLNILKVRGGIEGKSTAHTHFRAP